MLGYMMRPSNCDPKETGVCERCGEIHLRPGYCMALDPLNPRYDRTLSANAKDRTLRTVR